MLLLLLLLQLPLAFTNSNGEDTGCNAISQEFGCTCHTGNGYNSMCRDYHYDDPVVRGTAPNETVAKLIRRRCRDMTMGWVGAPTRTNDFSLRIGDCEPSQDRTSYTPDTFLDVHLRSVKYNRKLIGLVLYAVDENEKKVGEWDLPTIHPMKFRISSEGSCQNKVITHANGAKKNYHHVFHFKAPVAGTGPITFRCLVKEGGPNRGIFWWPNMKDVKLTEGPTKTAKWVRGETGQSCTTVCEGTLQKTCDADALKSSNAAQQIEGMQAKYTSQRPVLCSTNSYAPSSGGTSESFAFYHSDSCPASGAGSESTCDAVSSDPKDGSRLCPCGNGGAEADTRTYTNPHYTCQPPKPRYQPPSCGWEGCVEFLQELADVSSTSRVVPSMLASVLVLLLSSLTGARGSRLLFFGMLFATFGLCQGHNWLNSPSRSLQASTVQPCRPRNSDLPHVQVNPGMEFEFEWATGHGGATYVLILKTENFAKLYGMNRGKVEKYIKLADEAVGQTDFYKPKIHVVDDSKTIASITEDMPDEGKLYAGEIKEGDADYIKRSLRVASVRVRENYKLLSYKSDFAKNDGGWEWVNNHTDWHWLYAVYKYHHIYSRASEWDISMVRVPKYGYDGKLLLGDFIAHYRWGGYYDCIDVQVVPDEYPVTVDNMYGVPTGGVQYTRIDHCMFERYDSRLQSGCYELVTTPESCLHDCSFDWRGRPKSIATCAGVNVMPIKVPDRVYHQEEWQEKAINWTRCESSKMESVKEAFTGVPEDTHVCFSPRAVEDNSGLNGFYTISLDPEDFVFYSTCFVKVDNRNFTSGYPQPKPQPVPATWSFSGDCISCKDFHKNQNLPKGHHPEWVLADKCENCDELPIPAYEHEIEDYTFNMNLIAEGVGCDMPYVKDWIFGGTTKYSYQKEHGHNCTADGKTPDVNNPYFDDYKCVKVKKIRGSPYVSKEECQYLTRQDPECSETMMWRGYDRKYCGCWKNTECCGECSPTKDMGFDRSYYMSLFKDFGEGENLPDPNCDNGIKGENGYCCSSNCLDKDGVPRCSNDYNVVNRIRGGFCNTKYIMSSRKCSENGPPCVTDAHIEPNDDD